MPERGSLSIIIPTHNEAGSLLPLLERLSRLLHDEFDSTSEILVVDDASTDATPSVLKSAGIPLSIITHSRRKGSGAARKAGSLCARAVNCAWIDADGTYDPVDLIRLASHLQVADQVIGSRSAEISSPRFLRWAVKKSTATLAGVLWGTQIPDLNSGLRVFQREKMLEWLEEVPDGFSCTSTATLAALNHRQRVLFFPINYKARLNNAPSKFHPAWDTLRLWRAVWRCWMKYRCVK